MANGKWQMNQLTKIQKNKQKDNFQTKKTTNNLQAGKKTKLHTGCFCDLFFVFLFFCLEAAGFFHLSFVHLSFAII